jgi:hypothetical protein
MARKGKSTEEIIGFLREAEVRLVHSIAARSKSLLASAPQRR